MTVAESAVDVPRSLAATERKQEAEVEPSPVVKAPLAPQETYDENQQKQQQAVAATEMLTTTSAATTASAVLPRLNGQAVKDLEGATAVGAGDADTSFDTGVYQPNTTTYDDEDEEEEEEPGKPKPSLEEEIQQLDAQYCSAELNHVAPAAAAPAAAPAAKKKSGGRCGICGALVGSVLVALVLFAVLFYILYFSGLQHPALTETRNHLQFLEPVRDFVAQQAQDIASYFKK